MAGRSLCPTKPYTQPSLANLNPHSPSLPHPHPPGHLAVQTPSVRQHQRLRKAIGRSSFLFSKVTAAFNEPLLCPRPHAWSCMCIISVNPHSALTFYTHRNGAPGQRTGPRLGVGASCHTRKPRSHQDPGMMTRATGRRPHWPKMKGLDLQKESLLPWIERPERRFLKFPRLY